MSAIATPGGRSSDRRTVRGSDGSLLAVSGLTKTNLSSPMKAARSPSPVRSTAAAAGGAVSGSIPKMRSRTPPIRASPSMTGETSQPARRRATKTSGAINAPSARCSRSSWSWPSTDAAAS